jgi:hypothetical protein
MQTALLLILLLCWDSRLQSPEADPDIGRANRFAQLTAALHTEMLASRFRQGVTMAQVIQAVGEPNIKSSVGTGSYYEVAYWYTELGLLISFEREGDGVFRVSQVSFFRPLPRRAR